MDEMEKVIRKIIEDVPGKHIFDTHYVMKTIISQNTDDYLRFAGNYSSQERTTAVVNGQIGIMIGKQDDLCEKQEHPSFSRHLRDEGSKCTAWLRK